MRVIKKTFQEADELIFIGSEKEAKLIYDILIKYHSYDQYIQIELEDEKIPEFSTIDDFLKVWEYEYTLKEMK